VDFIGSLGEPRRSEIAELHELIRFKRPGDIDLGELRALLAEAVRLGPPA
jgi:hypothetical protein